MGEVFNEGEGYRGQRGVLVRNWWDLEREQGEGNTG